MLPPITFLGTQMATGGAQRMMLLQARWFHQQGYRIFAIFFYDKERLQDRWQSEYEYPITHLNGWEFGASPFTNAFRLVRALWRLWRFLRKNEISVIETFTPHSDLWGLPVAWLARVPVRIGCFQGIIQTMPQWQTSIHARMINTPVATGLVCVSNQMTDLALEMGIQPDKVVTIPNAMEIPDFETEADLHAWIGKKAINICCVPYRMCYVSILIQCSLSVVMDICEWIWRNRRLNWALKRTSAFWVFVMICWHCCGQRIFLLCHLWRKAYRLPCSKPWLPNYL